MSTRKPKNKRKWLIISLIILFFLSFHLYNNRKKYFHLASYYFQKVEFFFIGNEKNEGRIPGNYEFSGVDVSRHQGAINWTDLTEKGKIGDKKITFVFIKATEGQTYKDPYFDKNWSKAKKSGLIRGAYHYYQPHINSALQFKNFIQTVELETGDLPPVLDVEERGNLDLDLFIKGVENTLKLLEDYYEVKPIIYASPKFYTSYLISKKLQSYPFWLAFYGKNPPSNFEDNWIFWQYSKTGKVAGVNENIDLNVFHGTKSDLQKILVKY